MGTRSGMPIPMGSALKPICPLSPPVRGHKYGSPYFYLALQDDFFFILTGYKTKELPKGFSDSHFGSFYPQILVTDPQGARS